MSYARLKRWPVLAVFTAVALVSGPVAFADPPDDGLGRQQDPELEPEAGSLDGEVNSHSAWPSEDGSIVVEGEEDFNAWETVFPEQPPGNITFGDGEPPAPLPGTAIATTSGDDFEGSQTGNAGTVDADSLEVASGPLAGNTYPAIELG